MKILVLLMFTMCAALMGVLSFIYATGKIPYRPVAPPKVTQTEKDAKLTVPNDEKVMINELIQSLKAEREAFEKKRSDLDQGQSKEKLDVKIELLQKLKADLQQLQAGLQAEVKGIQESERKNYQSIADVYSKMEPENAAAIMKKTDKRRAAIVLSLMSERQAAAILDAVANMGDDGKTAAVEWADVIRKLKSQEPVKGAAKP